MTSARPGAASASASASLRPRRPVSRRRAARTTAAATVCLALAACGGGAGLGAGAGTTTGGAAVGGAIAGSSDAPAAAASSPIAVAAASVVLSGVAATGSAMTGAVVRVLDKRGLEVGRSAAVGLDGRFSVTLLAEAQAPFVLEAKQADGDAQVSVLDQAVGADVTVNITPITSLIAARLSPDGLPAGLVKQFEQAAGASASATPLPTAEKIQAGKLDVIRLLEPVRLALGDTTDPVTGRFAVGGVGHDKLLDSLAIEIRAKGATSASIEVTVRTKRDDETPMPSVAFASDTPAQDLPKVDSRLRKEDFGDDAVSPKLDALVAALNRCYALPVTDRVTSTTAAPRTAALVKDGPCKTVYYGADPAVFLDNGAVVGNGAGAGLFSADTLVFDRPVYEYTRAGVAGQTPQTVVFTVRWTNPQTQASDSMLVHARQDGQGDLRLYGNQYRYPMSVRPIVYRQSHLRTDSSHMDNLRTGYNLLVPNLQRDGQPMFERVEVMAPVGLERSASRDTFQLRPTIGHSYLRMTGHFFQSRLSNVVWMGGDWIDPAAAAGTSTTSGRKVAHPIQLDSGGAVWIDDPQGRGWGDDRLERLSHKSVWTFRYFLRGNTSQQPDAVQSMSTVSRAPSIREARQQRFATFSTASRQWLREMSMAADANMMWMSALLTAGSSTAVEPPEIILDWEVPVGAVPPTTVAGYGGTTTSDTIPWEQRTTFDRMLAVSSTQRKVRMTCATASAPLREVLCHNGGSSDRFSLRTRFADFELWGKDARQVEVSHSHATFVPSTRRTNERPEMDKLNAAP